MEKQVKQIAKVEQENITAWFDKVDNLYEIQWYSGYSARAYSFKTLEQAKDFWQEFVIEGFAVTNCRWF